MAKRRAPGSGPLAAALAALTLLPVPTSRVSGQATSAALVAAVLPSSRSATIGAPVTAFVSVVNAGSSVADGVGVFLRAPIPATLTFQTTDPSSNVATGTANKPVSLAAGRTQTFVITLTPTAAFGPTVVEFDFAPFPTGRVSTIVGVNTLLLSASTGPVADVVALAATTSRDGTVHAGVSGALATARATVADGTLPPVTHRGAFAVAAINAGAAADVITVAARAAGAASPSLVVQETDPVTGAVVGGSVRRLLPGETATFGVFA